MTPHTPKRHWDVIVLGAGPAGSALARHLARRWRVLVLDRSLPSASMQHPAAWRIGESLPGSAAVLLKRLELLDRFLQDGHAVRGASVSTWDVAEPIWFDTVRDPSGPGWHLDRMRFDALLRGAALESGAALASTRGRVQTQRDGTAWRVQEEGARQQHTATVLVDATGRRAALCRNMGLRRSTDDRLVCVHALLPGQSDDKDRCTRICADTNGWWYSVQLPSGQRVLAFHLDADDPDLRSLRNARALFSRARGLPVMCPVLPGAIRDSATQVLPAGSAILDLYDCNRIPGLYAVGDALLAFDPISSQGLFHALASAESAANAIARHLDGDGEAGLSYFAEMRRVQARYRAHLAETYAAPGRTRAHRFWARRSTAPNPHPIHSPEDASGGPVTASQLR